MLQKIWFILQSWNLFKAKDTICIQWGRLDVDTEGLLLISNDGKLTHEVLSPKKHVDKKYYVEFDGTLPENAVDFFNQPMEFEEFTSAPFKTRNIRYK